MFSRCWSGSKGSLLSGHTLEDGLPSCFTRRLFCSKKGGLENGVKLWNDVHFGGKGSSAPHLGEPRLQPISVKLLSAPVPLFTSSSKRYSPYISGSRELREAKP